MKMRNCTLSIRLVTVGIVGTLAINTTDTPDLEVTFPRSSLFGPSKHTRLVCTQMQISLCPANARPSILAEAGNIS